MTGSIEELELNVVRVAQAQHRSVRHVGDRRVDHSERSEPLRPVVQLGTAGHFEGQVVEASATWIERRVRMGVVLLQTQHHARGVLQDDFAVPVLLTLEALEDVEVEELAVPGGAGLTVGD